MDLSVGAEIELEIDALAAGGDAIGRHHGMAIFVPLAAPGDRARVRITQLHKRHARAEIVELLQPGPDRQEASCSYFGRCGGCDWMHLTAPAQRAARLSIVRDALQRIAGIADLPPVDYLESPAQFGYRSRARVAYAGGRVGFRARGSHEIVDIERCVVLDEATQRELDRVRARPPRGTGELNVRAYDDQVVVGAHAYDVGPRAFFQANRTLWESWLDTVLVACEHGELAVELYAGVGFYTAGLVKRFSRVVAVERGVHARDARSNAAAEVVEAAAEHWAPAHLAALRPDLVLLNPPRTGCHERVREAIRDCGARRLVYVSCDPSTLARDVKVLASRYSVTQITCIDALPNTSHAEIVASLQTKD